MKKIREWYIKYAPEVFFLIITSIGFIGSISVLLWVINVFINQIKALGW